MGSAAVKSYYILPVRCRVVSPLTLSRMGLERQKASVLNDGGDFNHMLLGKERGKKK